MCQRHEPPIQTQSLWLVRRITQHGQCEPALRLHQPQKTKHLPVQPKTMQFQPALLMTQVKECGAEVRVQTGIFIEKQVLKLGS